MLTYFQIRIVKDTVSPKSKPNRGYAFIVYEREKDMKGIIAIWITSALISCVIYRANHYCLRYLQLPTRKRMVYESRTDVSW